MEFKELEGQIFKEIKINQDNDEILFTTTMGAKYLMSHYQDCCESVSIEDLNGDLEDLLNTPILLAEERTSEDETPDGMQIPEWHDYSYTWTFYTLRTIKGTVDIRWFGSSNGYYSESVNIKKLS